MIRRSLLTACLTFFVITAATAVLLTDTQALTARVWLECGALCSDPQSLAYSVVHAFNTYRSELQAGIAELGVGGPADTLWQALWAKLLPENYFLTRIDVVRDYTALFCIRLGHFTRSAVLCALFIVLCVIDGTAMRRVAFVNFEAARPIAGEFALQAAVVLLIGSCLLLATPVPLAAPVCSLLLTLAGWALHCWIREYHRFG